MSASIYPQTTVQLMHKFVDERQGQPQFTVPEIVAWFRKNYGKLQESTVRAHVDMMTTNYPSRVHYLPKKVKPENDLFYRPSRGIVVKYDVNRHPAPIYRKVDT